MLQLKQVRKVFNKTVAVDSLDLTIPTGSIFGLLGPNGAGKTTTIRMIMNIIQPDAGEILYNGKHLEQSDFLKVGYLPEERGLYQKMKLKETVVYLARLKGLSPAEANQSVDEYLRRFDLSGYSNRRIEELSKGNQQKVQFIVSVIHKPELIILDEPFAGLDPVNQLLLKEIIAELQGRGATVIFSTHQMEQVEKLCDRICLINKGKPILDGDLRQIKKEYGQQMLLIDYDGQADALADLNLPDMQITDNRLTCRLTSNLNELLLSVMQRVQVTRFELQEPSLEQIFIELVRGAEEP
ncbi:MAG TPA: ATP-binding cassette domain-containing protein [Candidatus Marinimicrobia bacterium]|nr:ATP-binding cassette domain-containing protein [Candidatus Neomarinimicrobiota bacterium]HRS52188.1 ATP-binding cassette domain-containing protein [Candidatus Neomarinimicrobiota bacterium]HRU91979.1 ATP-binding cassette domain-containing protein [Candidatus Neomarinimicrobiota bacterium]